MRSQGDIFNDSSTACCDCFRNPFSTAGILRRFSRDAMKQKILLVDGHSMIFDWEDLASLHGSNTTAAREELIRRLTGLQDNSDWTVAVVFDGTGMKASSDGTPHGIAVFYSKSGQTADSIIERLAAKYAKEHEVTVATNDRMERMTAEAFGSMTISGLQLRAEIETAHSVVRDTIRRLRR